MTWAAQIPFLAGRGLWPQPGSEAQVRNILRSHGEAPSPPHLRVRPRNPCCFKRLGQWFFPGGNSAGTPPWKTLGDVWSHGWLSPLGVLLASSEWGPKVLLDPHSAWGTAPAVRECPSLGNPGWKRQLVETWENWELGAVEEKLLGSRSTPRPEPSGKFFGQGASFRLGVGTCECVEPGGVGGMGAWQPGLGDEVGPVSEKGHGGVGGGCAGRVGSWGCRTVPGWLGQGCG